MQSPRQVVPFCIASVTEYKFIPHTNISIRTDRRTDLANASANDAEKWIDDVAEATSKSELNRELVFQNLPKCKTNAKRGKVEQLLSEFYEP